MFLVALVMVRVEQILSRIAVVEPGGCWGLLGMITLLQLVLRQSTLIKGSKSCGSGTRVLEVIVATGVLVLNLVPIRGLLGVRVVERLAFFLGRHRPSNVGVVEWDLLFPIQLLGRRLAQNFVPIRTIRKQLPGVMNDPVGHVKVEKDPDKSANTNRQDDRHKYLLTIPVVHERRQGKRDKSRLVGRTDGIELGLVLFAPDQGPAGEGKLSKEREDVEGFECLDHPTVGKKGREHPQKPDRCGQHAHCCEVVPQRLSCCQWRHRHT